GKAALVWARGIVSFRVCVPVAALVGSVTLGCAPSRALLFFVCAKKSRQKKAHPDIRVSLRVRRSLEAMMELTLSPGPSPVNGRGETGRPCGLRTLVPQDNAEPLPLPLAGEGWEEGGWAA